MWNGWERAFRHISIALSSSAPRFDGAEVAQWMIKHSYATGHGDTVSDMLDELEAQAKLRSDGVEAGLVEALETIAHPDGAMLNAASAQRIASAALSAYRNRASRKE
jgi:hypothetical protein